MENQAVPPQPATPLPTPVQPPAPTPQGGMSQETKQVIVIILLIIPVTYWLGLIFMYAWMKWRLWVKLLITLPFVLGIIAFVAVVVLGLTVAPDIINQATECVNQCQTSIDQDTCMEQCLETSAGSNVDIEIDSDFNSSFDN